jgi:hypothetical protein
MFFPFQFLTSHVLRFIPICDQFTDSPSYLMLMPPFAFHVPYYFNVTSCSCHAKFTPEFRNFPLFVLQFLVSMA